MKRTCTGLLALLLPACAIPNSIESLQADAPPPEFGRPAWVRTCAGVGAWVGGVTGGVVSIVLLPATYPISLLAGDALGEQGKDEFLFFPAMSLAAVGHGFVGMPADLIDIGVRRLWIHETDPVNSYEWVPMPAAEKPVPPPGAAQPAATAGSQ